MRQVVPLTMSSAIRLLPAQLKTALTSDTLVLPEELVAALDEVSA